MKVSTLQEQLARGLGIVSRAVDTRTTLPVLANVLLSADDAQLKLTATNLQMSVTSYIGAKVERPGAITLPAKTLAELVANLAPERVDMTLDPATQSVNVRCGTTVSNIRGIAASEFPPIPEGGDPDVMLPARTFREMIVQTVFAAAKEDNRPILTGVYMQFDGDVLTMAAADGFRLAVRTARIEQHFDPPRELVVPARTLTEVARIIVDDEGEVGISLPGERDLILFFIENTVVTSQLLEGRFPDFSAIIPKTYNTAITVYTSDLLRACKRAEIFARDNNFSTRFTARPPANPGEPGTVLVTGRSNERGDNEGLIDASVEGESLEAAFNIRYMIDVLSVIHEESVIVESCGPASAGVIRPQGRDDFLHIIMPMSLTR
jgi:DNA polymerase-3 subunit beta